MINNSGKLVAALAAITACAVPAQAKEYRVQISAHVPISCEASISGGFTEVATQQFRIGRINQFCNTGYRMSFSYAGVADGAEFRIRNRTVPMLMGSTLIEAAGRPINAANDIYLSNIDRQAATIVASTLNVSVTPTGL